MKKSILLSLIFAVVFSSPTYSQRKNKKDKMEEEVPEKSEYEKLTADKNIVGDGLFRILKSDDKYYFEIPEEVRTRDFLIVSKISGFVEDLKFGGAGMSPRPEYVIRWDKLDNKVLLRAKSYHNRASEELPVAQSVRYNNFEPILSAFDIKAYSPDSSSCIIDVTGFFTGDTDIISPLSNNDRQNFKIKNLDKSRSLISSIKVFPENIEVRHILTYNGTEIPDNQSTGTLSVEMNQSIVLLPEEPMMPRYGDHRIGHFSSEIVDYGADEDRAHKERIIRRWRLEPKDREAYFRGEVVEPVKPIVYYIDPATPERFKKYFKLGIEDWQPAFEKAGFKNAIIAKDAPSKEEDPDWSPEDIRYSVVRYITTEIINAQGPHTHDPRSGEIIESDILWYHNIMVFLRTWRMAQIGAIDDESQKARLSEEEMGRMIRYVMAHEVGHTLGFPHNMAGSSAYPVDSLRSPSFTNKWGISTTIMEYARNNYVAQPGDGDVYLVNDKIGPYDDYVTNYSYRVIEGVNSPKDEVPTLNKWIEDKAGDPVYRYGRQTAPFDHPDPTAQSEDLGDNSVKASRYGLANLERIVPNIVKWNAVEGDGYVTLEEAYFNGVMYQWFNYIRHVSNNIGGVFYTPKNYDQEGNQYDFISEERQREAMEFLQEEIYKVPSWLLNENILRRLEMSGVINRIQNYHNLSLSMVLDESRMARLIEFELFRGKEAYSLNEMMTDLRKGIWSELKSGRRPDVLRRNLQKSYLNRLEYFMDEDYSPQSYPSDNAAIYFGYTPVQTANSDIKSSIVGQLTQLSKDIGLAVGRSRDLDTKNHLIECKRRVDKMLKI